MGPELGLSLFSSQLLSFLPWRVVVLPAESAEPSATIEQLRSQDLNYHGTWIIVISPVLVLFLWQPKSSCPTVTL